MKRYLLFVACIGGLCLVSHAAAVAAPQEGLLVTETGDTVTGYSEVLVDNGLAYPVQDLKTGTWYSVIVVGTADDGTLLCTLGEPMEPIPEGVRTDEGGPGEEAVDDGGGR